MSGIARFSSRKRTAASTEDSTGSLNTSEAIDCPRVRENEWHTPAPVAQHTNDSRDALHEFGDFDSQWEGGFDNFHEEQINDDELYISGTPGPQESFSRIPSTESSGLALFSKKRAPPPKSAGEASKTAGTQPPPCNQRTHLADGATGSQIMVTPGWKDNERTGSYMEFHSSIGGFEPNPDLGATPSPSTAAEEASLEPEQRTPCLETARPVSKDESTLHLSNNIIPDATPKKHISLDVQGATTVQKKHVSFATTPAESSAFHAHHGTDVDDPISTHGVAGADILQTEAQKTQIPSFEDCFQTFQKESLDLSDNFKAYNDTLLDLTLVLDSGHGELLKVLAISMDQSDKLDTLKDNVDKLIRSSMSASSN